MTILLEQYLEGEEPDIEDLKRCIRKGTIALDFFPTFCGSAFKNKGIQNVLDAVVELPAGPDGSQAAAGNDLEGHETGGSRDRSTRRGRSVPLPSRSWTTAMVP